MTTIHEEVTTKIIAELEAGTPPWVRPWSETPGLNLPCNPISKRLYLGVNVLLLWSAVRTNKWPTPRFVTYKQAREVGGHVRKGERGTPIFFVKDLVFKNFDGDGDGERRVRMLKTYVVFNVAQCDGLPSDIVTPPPPKPRHRDGRIPVIEEFIAAIGVTIHEGGNIAAYYPEADCIRMPAFASFDSGAAFYCALFHEVVHWTGAKHRLNRFADNALDYFKPAERIAGEELIAELGSAFLCAEFDIDAAGSAQYIAGWITLLKAHPRAIFTCASKAQAAVDYLRALVLSEPAVAAE